MTELLTGRLSDVTGSNHIQLYFNVNDLFIETKLEDSYTGDFYISGLANDDQLFGSVLIVCKKGYVIDYPGVIDTFIYQASLTLNQQHIEKELIKAKEEAIQAGELKTAFLANMSHEIRTPMNGIIGFSELLRNKNITQEKKEKYIDIITENSKYLLTLINDIIDISKIQSGQVNVMYTEYPLNRLFSELHQFFSLALGSKNKGHIELTIDCGLHNGEDVVLIDAIRLQQILNNLLGNAIKFTNTGSIEFGYKLTEDQKLCFYVKDTGIGLPENKKHMIFDRFTQADYSSTRKYGGTGLGLSISKGLVELMGGTIWVESEIDKGSTFYFTLPYTPFKEIKPTLVGDTSYDIPLSFRSILIVEDDPGSVMLLEELLAAYKTRLIKTEFGHQAVELCKQNSEIDLVLMDINLPDMNGYEATRKIKQFNPQIIVIAQTANAFKNEETLAYEAGCDDYLSKPIEAVHLYHKLKKFSK
jgi:signal transduction histidine kinase